MGKCKLTAMIVWLAAASVLLTCTAARAEKPQALAERILRAVDRPVALAHLPRSGDGSFAFALTEADDGLYVHGQDADADAVAAARRTADERGLLNCRVSFDVGGLDRLLPVGRSSDLVLLTDLSRKELRPELATEIGRVLHPWYGVAVLGDTSGKLDVDSLEEWAKSIAPDVSGLPGEGSLVMVRAEPLTGADNWSHWWHGPDNNACSNDYAYSWPETVQWTGKPYFSTRLELPIVANGRLFMLWNGHMLDSTRGEPVLPGEDVAIKTQGWETVLDGPLSKQRGPLLTARTVGSGVRLWHRRLSPEAWLQAARGTVVADGDRLLVGDGPDLLLLDQATGEELNRIETECEEIKWLAATDRYVAILGGPNFNRFPDRMRRTNENVVPFRSSGLSLTLLDRDTLKKLWQERREEGAHAFDPRSPAITGGRLFVCTEGGGAEAYRISDGKLQWKTDTGIVRQKPRAYEWDRSSRHPVTGCAVSGLYIISGPETDRCAVLSQEDGKPMWDLERGRGPVGPIPLTFRDLVWFDENGVKPETGETIHKVSLTRGGCSRFTAAPQGILGNEGLTWDAIADESRQVLPAKSGCGAGQYAANGMAWKFPTPCSACMEWRGFIPRAAAEKGLPSPGNRLSTGTESAAPGAEAPGWVTYRGNAGRSASVAARVSRDAALAWRTLPSGKADLTPSGGSVMLGPEMVPAPPVTGSDTAVVGFADGTLQAFDLKTGRARWRAQTGGRIYSSPTVRRDQVFVGSADGYLYAFRLDDGQELWRLRVAPEAGRMMLYGRLGSRWPVLGSPLVADSRVYVTAGLLEMLDGVWAVAADAVTGEVIWQRNDWSAARTHNILAGNSQMCWTGDRIVYQGGQAPLVVLDPEDGDCGPLFESKEVSPGHMLNRGAMGQEVAAFAPGVVLFGGRRLFAEDREDAAWRNSLTFRVDREGEEAFYCRVRPRPGKSDCNRMPAWDAEDVAYVDTGQNARHQRLALIPRERFLKALHESRSVEATNRWDARAGASPLRLDLEKAATWVTEEFGYVCDVRGCVLAENAAVILVQFREERQTPDGEVRDRFWHVAAFARGDGEKMWEVDLPSVPLRDGLAVAADGRVIVTLRDGSVICCGPKEQVNE